MSDEKDCANVSHACGSGVAFGKCESTAQDESGGRQFGTYFFQRSHSSAYTFSAPDAPAATASTRRLPQRAFQRAGKPLADVRMVQEQTGRAELPEAEWAAAVAPFEHYMYADDRPDAPMTFFMRFRFVGPFDLPRFEAAVDTARHRHPLLQSVIQGSRDAPTDELRWRRSPGARPAVIVSRPGDAFPAYPTGEPGINISQNVGVRFFLRQNGQETLLLLQMHHAVADARGATKLMDDILTVYDGRDLPRDEASLAGTDPLAHRLDVAFSPSITKAGRARTIKMLLEQAEPLAPMPQTREPEALLRFPATVSAVLDEVELDHLRSRAASAGASVNDLLLHDLLVAMDRVSPIDPGPRTLRLGIPVDLRPAARVADEVANCVGFAFLERQRGEIAGAGLLAGIAAETQALKSEGCAAAFCRAVALAGRTQGGLQHFCSADRCTSTAVLSNLLRPFDDSALIGDDGLLRAGGLTLVSCELVPPVRPLTSVSIGVVTYASRVWITLQHDARALSNADAQGLLDVFVGLLRA